MARLGRPGQLRRLPANGPAPLRVGTGYRRSHFAGAIGDVVFFDRALAPGRIRAHYRALWAAEGP